MTRKKILSPILVNGNQKNFSLSIMVIWLTIMVPGKERKFRSFVLVTGNENEISVIDNDDW